MDIYLHQQQHQMKPNKGIENHIGVQSLNYSQIPQSNNSINQNQFVPQQALQTTMIYQPNQIRIVPSTANMTQNEQQINGNDSKKDQPIKNLQSVNPNDSSNSSNSRSPSNSQEIQSSSFDSQTSQEINANDHNIKANTIINSENVKKKQNQSQNATLKEIIGIVPKAGPDHQNVFVCRFSDSVNNEYVANKQMRKRFSLQLIKFYESHIKERVPRPNHQQIKTVNST